MLDNLDISYVADIHTSDAKLNGTRRKYDIPTKPTLIQLEKLGQKIGKEAMGPNEGKTTRGATQYLRLPRRLTHTRFQRPSSTASTLPGYATVPQDAPPQRLKTLRIYLCKKKRGVAPPPAVPSALMVIFW